MSIPAFSPMYSLLLLLLLLVSSFQDHNSLKQLLNNRAVTQAREHDLEERKKPVQDSTKERLSELAAEYLDERVRHVAPHIVSCCGHQNRKKTERRKDKQTQETDTRYDAACAQVGR